MFPFFTQLSRPSVPPSERAAARERQRDPLEASQTRALSISRHDLALLPGAVTEQSPLRVAFPRTLVMIEMRRVLMTS
jgi:hypothetical protein